MFGIDIVDQRAWFDDAVFYILWKVTVFSWLCQFGAVQFGGNYNPDVFQGLHMHQLDKAYLQYAIEQSNGGLLEFALLELDSALALHY